MYVAILVCMEGEFVQLFGRTEALLQFYRPLKHSRLMLAALLSTMVTKPFESFVVGRVLISLRLAFTTNG